MNKVTVDFRNKPDRAGISEQCAQLAKRARVCRKDKAGWRGISEHFQGLPRDIGEEARLGLVMPVCFLRGGPPAIRRRKTPRPVAAQFPARRIVMLKDADHPEVQDVNVALIDQQQRFRSVAQQDIGFAFQAHSFAPCIIRHWRQAAARRSREVAIYDLSAVFAVEQHNRGGGFVFAYRDRAPDAGNLANPEMVGKHRIR